MKKLHHFFSTCLLLLILTSFGFGQTSGWPTSYTNLNVRAMTIDASGNIYITGPADGGKKTGLDFVTVKYAPNGHLEWSAQYNGPSSGEDWPYAIAVDVNGNVFVTGRSFTSKSGGSSYNFDYATVKYNPQGGLVWARRFGSAGNKNDVAQDVKVDVTGNAYVTGYTDASLVLGGGNAIVTIKYNQSGDTAWTAKYDVLPNIYGDSGNPNQEQAYSLAVDADGNVCIAGTVLVKYNSSGLIAWEDRSINDRREVLVDHSNNVFTTGFSGKTSKYDASGNLLWETSSTAGFWDIALDQTGNVYVTGNISDASGNSSDFWTVKYDGNNNGSELWSRRFNGSANSTDFGRSITVDNSGNVYVTGHSTAASGRNTITVFRVIKYNDNGEQWVTTDEGDGFVIETDAGGNVYATGTVPGTRSTAAGTKTYKFTPSSPAPRSVTTAPTVEAQQNNFSLKNYPNPFSQSTIIEYKLPVEGKVKLTVFDLSGHEIATLVNEYKPIGIHKINFKANKLPAGTYFYRIQAEKYTETKKLIILK